MGNERARDGERVLLREIMVGGDIDPAGDPSEFARSDELPQPFPADSKGGEIPTADHAAVADRSEGIAW